MPTRVTTPKVINAAGTPPKRIEEFIGRLSTGSSDISIARMKSPGGWSESGQTPEFDEYTLVISGTLHVKTKDGDHDVHAGQALIVRRGEWVQYSTPGVDGAEYIAVCLPAFSPDTVHRDH